MYYNGGELLSKNRLINFLIGNRGGGKSYHWKVRCVRDFLKEGKEFVWLRRYNTELENMKNWAKDIAHEFEGVKIEASKKHIRINGKIAGHVGALSTSQRLKSNPYPMVDKIIFDEFLIDKGSLRYIKGECELMLELIETIFRMRDDNNKVVFIANAISIVNPYFTYFNVKPNLDKRFTLYEDIAIELYLNEEFVKKKKQTRFGRLISNTAYGDYAIENKFLRDNYSFVKDRPSKNLQYANTVVYDGMKFGVWLCYDDENYLYIDDIIEPNCSRVITINMEDIDETGKYKKHEGMVGYIHQIKFYFNDGKIWFNNIETKKYFYEVIKAL